MSVFSIFKRGLEKSTTGLKRSFTSLIGQEKIWDEAKFELLLERLVMADFGVPASSRIVDRIRDAYEHGHISSSEDIYDCAAQEIEQILRQNQRDMKVAAAGPTVILFAGVNGAGKTTSIGKLAHRFVTAGKSVMLAACDTWRAAAAEQLGLWSKRTGALIVSSVSGADPSSVAFDAVQSAIAKNVDYLLIDTAGRQQNQRGLMDELAKIRRTISKLLPGAPHETILVIDASLGANAVSQAKGFSESGGVSGLIVTKLDGSGRGGMAAALHQEFGLPTFYVGLGEKPEDLVPFDPVSYSKALLFQEEK